MIIRGYIPRKISHFSKYQVVWLRLNLKMRNEDIETIQIWVGVTEAQTQALMYSLTQPTPNKIKCEKKEMKLPILETEGCG